MDREITSLQPAAILPRIEKIVERANKKLSRFGLENVSLTYVLLNKETQRPGVLEELAEITLRLPQIDAGKGWRLVAIFRPGITEGYAYLLPGRVEKDIPPQYRDPTSEDATNCEHCGWIRNRKTTVLLRNDHEDRWIRVGSTCVGEFLDSGADRVMVAIKALDRLRAEIENPQAIMAAKAYDSKLVVAATIQYLSKGGQYINGRNAYDQGTLPTWKEIRELIDPSRLYAVGRKGLAQVQPKPTATEPRFQKLADKWIGELPGVLDKIDPKRERNYHRNLETALCHDGNGTGAVTTESGAFATVVSFPLFVKSIAKKNGTTVTQKKTQAELEIGTTYKFEVKVSFLGRAFQSDFHSEPHSVRRYSGQSSTGQTVTWFGRKDQFTEIGETKKVRCRVKEVTDYRGEVQYVLHHVHV